MTSPFISPTVDSNYLQLLRLSRSDAKAEEKAIEALGSITEQHHYVQPLLPLLYRNALSLGIFEKLSEPTQNTIKQGALVMVAREMGYQAWLSENAKLFDQAGIPIILLKGAAFSHDLYTAEAPRPGVDLDFLVRTAHFEMACETLEKSMSPVVMDQNRAATHRSLFERMFRPTDKPFPVVEVHRGLTNPHIFNIEEAELWNASVPHPAHGDDNIRTLSPEHTLLHLATHAFRDLDFCSHTLLDVYELFRQKTIDHDYLVQQAHSWGARNVLYCLLGNAHTIMNAPIPAELLDSLQPKQGRLTQFREILQAETLPHNEKSPEYRRLQLRAQLVFPDRLANALRFQGQYAITRLRDLFSR